MAVSRLESMINQTLAGNNKKLTEMSGAVLDTIIDQNTHAGRLIQDTLIGSTLEQLTGSNGTFGQNEPNSYGGQLLSLTAATTTTATNGSIEMGQTERLFWVLIFSVMVLIAAGGNTIVVYIVATNKEMKSVTNYFLVNLSLADTMVSTLNVIFNFISMLNSHWPFGKVYCKISNFIAILSISASVFTLTAISCDRYNAIIHPLRPRMSHRHAIGWILLIWTLSSALAMPNFIYSTDLEDRLTNDNVAVTCTMLWPDGRYPLSSYDHIYNIVVLVVTYLVPILTMAILYYKVGKELWGYEAIGENIDKQQRAIMAKKKIVKMMIVVVIIFALCWLPYHAFFVVNYYVPTIFQDSPLHYQRCYLFMYWLAMSNSMYNPIIIYFMNSKFRHEFKKILCMICCCSTYKPIIRTATTANTIMGNQQQRTSAAHLNDVAINSSHNNSRRQTDASNIVPTDNLPSPPLTSMEKQSTSRKAKDHQTFAQNESSNHVNQTPVAIKINSIPMESDHVANHHHHGQFGGKNDDEQEPFISIKTNGKQIVNNGKIIDLNGSANFNTNNKNSDRMIDLTINNNKQNNSNNIDNTTYPPKTSAQTNNHKKVWI